MLKRPTRVSLTISGADMQPSNRIAVITARPDSGEDRLGVLLHEQHRGDNDVGLADGFEAAAQCCGIVPIGRGMEGEVEPGDIALQAAARAIDRARQMIVERDDDDAQSRRAQRPKWALAS